LIPDRQANDSPSAVSRSVIGEQRKTFARNEFFGLIPPPDGSLHVLQFGNVPRLHQRTLAVDVPKPLSDGAPQLEMRVMTKERRVGVELADDLPDYSGHSGKLC